MSMRKTPPHPLGVRNRADTLLLAVERQQERCMAPIPSGPLGPDVEIYVRTVVEHLTDIDLFIVVLYRLLRLAEWAALAPFATDELRREVAAFKKSVPHLREMRDTQEHFDDYGGGVGKRQRAGEPQLGWGYSASTTGGIVSYGDFTLDIGAATRAANGLHRAIRSAVDPLAARDIHGGPETIILPLSS